MIILNLFLNLCCVKSIRPLDYNFMKLEFDERGNIKPYELIEISPEEFVDIFVDSFSNHSSRAKLYSNYKKYLRDLSALVKYDFYQMIDGSFITKKQNPRDIDLVTVLNFQDYEENRDALQKQFSPLNSRKKYSVDAYIVANYPEFHKNHVFSRSDILYWIGLFGRTRMDRSKRQYNKGIIRLNFSKNG